MAKIIDPDNLDVIVNSASTGEEVEIQTGAKTIKLVPNSEQGTSSLYDTSPGSGSGVTGKCVYSKMKEVWESDSTLNKYKFPIQMIYEAQFIWINGWGPEGDQSRDLFRDAGFKETDGRENACIISLGSMYDTTQTSHYTNDFTSEFAETPLAFDKTGTLNENIQIIGTGGTPDNSDYFKAFLREEQRTFSSYNLLGEQGLTALTYQAYRLPLANANDIKSIYADTEYSGDIGTMSGVTYSELFIDYIVGTTFDTATITTFVADEVLQDTAGRWFRVTTGGTLDAAGVADYTTNGGTAVLEAYPGERQIGSSYYAFNRIIDGDDVGATSARLPEIYGWSQWMLRKATDINNDTGGDIFGTVRGDIAMELLYYIGDTLHTMPGVYIDNFNTNDKNDIKPHDITVDGGGLDSEYIPVLSTIRPFPFVSAGTLTFNAALTDETDVDTQYTMYFEYHTRTTGSYTLTLDVGSDGDLTWSGTDLDHIIGGDKIILTGFITTTAMDGEYLVNTVGANTMNITHQGGVTIVTEGPISIQVDENPFESLGATIVDDNSDIDIDGDVSATQLNWDYDYSTNSQRGSGQENTDAAIIVVGIAKDGAQYVSVPYTITAATGQNINVFPQDELNYSNPT